MNESIQRNNQDGREYLNFTTSIRALLSMNPFYSSPEGSSTTPHWTALGEILFSSEESLPSGLILRRRPLAMPVDVTLS